MTTNTNVALVLVFACLGSASFLGVSAFHKSRCRQTTTLPQIESMSCFWRSLLKERGIAKALVEQKACSEACLQVGQMLVQSLME
eukprot:5281455-Amphidinium_carterae.1